MPGELNNAGQLVAQMLAHIDSVAILPEHALTPYIVFAQLRTALTSRVVVEQAQGFLRKQLERSVEDAFVLLRRHVRPHNNHLTEVSRRLISEPETRQVILAAMRRAARD
jgi:hypothetical protein